MGNVKLRIFRTCDHSTNWIENVPGSQEFGRANVYQKDPGWFATDYETAIDWCAENGINAISVKGLLRDRHGGVAVARRICDYAISKGVRIILRAGIFTGGGIFYENYDREDPHSLEYFLKHNPECAEKDHDGKPISRCFAAPYGSKREAVGDPSNAKLREFTLDAVNWVFRTIPSLGGIECEELSLNATIDFFPSIVSTVNGCSRDALVVCDMAGSCAGDAWNGMASMPESTLFQWNASKIPDQVELPESLWKYRHVLHSDCASQWNGGRDAFAVSQIRNLCLRASKFGFEGVSMFGESSPHRVNAEMNYLALSYFAADTARTLDGFAGEIMAPLLGGESAVVRFLEFADLRGEPNRIPSALKEIAEIASGFDDYRVVSRWYSLAEFLASVGWEAERKSV